MALQNVTDVSEVMGVKQISVERIREVVNQAVDNASFMREEMAAMRGRSEIMASDPEREDNSLAASVASTETAAPESPVWQAAPQAPVFETEEPEAEQEQDGPDF